MNPGNASAYRRSPETPVNPNGGAGGDRLREINLKSLPCIRLPRPAPRWEESRRARQPAQAKEIFEVLAAGWRLTSIGELAPGARPDPALRRFHPTASGLLMIDDLGNARGFGEIELQPCAMIAPEG
jgi:hypothetical protein